MTEGRVQSPLVGKTIAAVTVRKVDGVTLVVLDFTDGASASFLSAPARVPTPGACGDPKCYVLHADPKNPIHPPWYVDSRIAPEEHPTENF